MKTKYDQLMCIHDRAVADKDANALGEIPALLSSWGIRCRADDGQLLWTNLSVPTSVAATITIGLRYQKRDASLTEDIFELRKSDPDAVEAFYKGKYQRVRPEYSGTHKFQIVLTQSFTSVNTCCLFLGGKYGS